MTSDTTDTQASSTALAPNQRAVPVGHGAAYRLPAVSAIAARRGRITGLVCTRSHPRWYGIHLELYAHGLVLPVPAGIGIAPPQRRSGVYVLGGACSYPIRTFEPTGVTVVDTGRIPTLGQLFAVWNQPLSAHELADFKGPVLAFVGGRRWHGAVRAIRLRRHAEIVLEVAGYVAPHATYRFPPGL